MAVLSGLSGHRVHAAGEFRVRGPKGGFGVDPKPEPEIDHDEQEIPELFELPLVLAGGWRAFDLGSKLRKLLIDLVRIGSTEGQSKPMRAARRWSFWLLASEGRPAGMSPKSEDRGGQGHFQPLSPRVPAS